MDYTLVHTEIEKDILKRMSQEDYKLLVLWIIKQRDPRCSKNHGYYYEETLNKFVCHICKEFIEVKINV